MKDETIHFLPPSKPGYAEEFAKMIIRKVTEQLGLTFEQMSANMGYRKGGYVSRPPSRHLGFAWSTGHAFKGTIGLRVAFICGYNPQLLLEDHHGRT